MLSFNNINIYRTKMVFFIALYIINPEKAAGKEITLSPKSMK